MSSKEIEGVLVKLRRLLDIPKCEDSDYTRTSIPKQLAEEIYDDQNGKCFLCTCNTTVPMTHHIKPDGESSRENLVMLCSTCHTWVHWILKKYLGYRGTAMFNRKW